MFDQIKRDAVVTLRVVTMAADSASRQDAVVDVLNDSDDNRVLFDQLIFGTDVEQRNARRELQWAVEAQLSNIARSGRLV
jgi:hypothetical protein